MAAVRCIRMADALRKAAATVGHWGETLHANLEACAGAPGAPELHSRIVHYIGRTFAKPLFFIARAGQRTGFGRFAARAARGAALLDDITGRRNWEVAKSLLRSEAHLPTGILRENRQRWIAALRTMSLSSDGSIMTKASVTLARALHEAGFYAESLAAAERALSAAPGNPKALAAKANALMPLRRFAEAREIWRRLPASDPQNPDIRLRIADALSAGPAIEPVAPADEPGNSKPSLVAVGGGIGDILHATPTIRNIARRTKCRVKVLVCADHPHAEFLLANPEYVSQVWPVTPEALNRRYADVFLAHSFGSLRLPFTADRVFISSNWRRFRPGLLHETLFNLEAAKNLLEIPYSEGDAQGYFVGDLVWRRPAEPLIGLHAGSKPGRWLSKRWPGFAELAVRLRARGLRVASFGTAEEYVEATENRTGGTIEEMCRSMLDCTHFVSNDSGPMHIASALGIPTLALFAPTDVMTHLPLRPSTIGLALEKRCSPCEVKNHSHFAAGYCRCIGELSAEHVERRLLELVSQQEEALAKSASAKVEPRAGFSESAIR